MNRTRTLFLMALLTGLLVVLGGALAGRQGATLAFVMAAAMNFYAYWRSDKVVLSQYRARALSRENAPELFQVVEELSQRAGIPVPSLYLIPGDTPNAFATGRNPEHAAVAVTGGLMKALETDEIRGVLAHELGHVRNRDILTQTIAATLGGAVSLMGTWARYGSPGSQRRGGGILLLLTALLAPVAALLIRSAISRTREFAADEAGAMLAGDPEPLASALLKLEAWSQRRPMRALPTSAHMFIVNPLRGGGMARLFSTHPPTEERVRRLRALAPSSAG